MKIFSKKVLKIFNLRLFFKPRSIVGYYIKLKGFLKLFIQNNNNCLEGYIVQLENAQSYKNKGPEFNYKLHNDPPVMNLKKSLHDNNHCALL